MTRSILSAPGGIVSPGTQFGTAVCGVGGKAGVPSSWSSQAVEGEDHAA